jgi:hypothetical protein
MQNDCHANFYAPITETIAWVIRERKGYLTVTLFSVKYKPQKIY